MDTQIKINPIRPMVSYEDWMKLDIRVGVIIEAYDIPESEKLLRLIVDIGTEKRHLISGTKTSYKPEELIGQKILVAANVKPRKMRFGISEGLALVATFPGYEHICSRFIAENLKDATPGMNL